jgi:hypothetical protein
MFDDELLDPIGKHLFTITADPLAAPAESLSQILASPQGAARKGLYAAQPN